MKTLQYAHQRLTDLKLSPAYLSKAKVSKGKLIYSPYSVVIHCPKKFLSKYLWTLEKQLPHFKLVYVSESEELLINPTDKKYQFIANAIYSCSTREQIDSAEKLLESNYPGDFDLRECLDKKISSLVI